MADYGERFEAGTIIAMTIAIIASLIFVLGLNVAYKPDCRESNYTYCGDATAPY